MRHLDVLILYNEPSLPPESADSASEAGVLESVAAVGAALTAKGHRVTRLAVGADLRTFLTALAEMPRPDVVFNLFEGLEGTGKGESYVAGSIELLGIPLTGSSPECLALVIDKARTKWLLAGAGLPTADFCLVTALGEVDDARLNELLERGAVIVKPAHEDASLGIGQESVVSDLGRLRRQIELTLERYGPALVEQFIRGREFNVGVIATPEPEVLPLAEIEFDARLAADQRLLTYEAKWAAGSEADRATPPRCPADVDPALAGRLRSIALAAFQITGCRDYARVDFRVDETGQPYILEVNGNPDLSPAAGLARAMAVAGWDYADFIDRLTWLAARRRAEAKHHPACSAGTAG